MLTCEGQIVGMDNTKTSGGIGARIHTVDNDVISTPNNPLTPCFVEFNISKTRPTCKGQIVSPLMTQLLLVECTFVENGSSFFFGLGEFGHTGIISTSGLSSVIFLNFIFSIKWSLVILMLF